ncbi:acyl--CoA ligase [Mycobacterium fragae]|uniref:AMP-binding protein n=1 Tax=Mycobacterium fragae TaxID=1260918 RepID=A0A1X1V0I7_9MYCO|nr:class I adenylate-forming enzyme family protein [Mycobacterium fragae]MCV7398874.1 acyl--CoA ligase [Mycobacterium fragae]ORV62593.1 AMP-binding protein [Mycobacterium fragae]
MPIDSPTVGEILRGQVRSRGDHQFLVCDAERVSYAEADRRSAQLARGLMALGAGKGSHVGLMYPNGVAFVLAMLAAARIGAVAVPFSTFATAPELRDQLVDSDVQILLAAASYRSHDYARRVSEVLSDSDLRCERRLFNERVPQLRHVVIDTDKLCALAATLDETLLTAMEQDVDGSDPLAIIYTSGTTSAPKGVVHTHGALLNHQRNLNEIRALSADDKLFCNSPFFWIGGFAFALLATLVAGSTLVCSNASDAAQTLDLLEAEKPTAANGFAVGIAHLVRHPSFASRDLSSMRRGNLYPIMAPEVRPADPELRHNMLGLTEAGSVVSISDDEGDQPEHRRGSFGKPAPGFETKVLDPHSGMPVAEGELGELCIRGPYLMQRYYKRSREECFDVDGWFHTGDLVATDRDGFLYFIRRRDSMIKTAGANVSPSEVEKAIGKVTGGVVAHVVGIPDPERGQVVAAVIAVENGAQFDENALRRALTAELSAYKIPKRFAVIPADRLPLLSSGKVDLHELKKIFDG